MSQRPRVALVSREVAPFGGGGLGEYVRATANLLAADADVTVFTTSRHRRRHEELRRRRPEALPQARFRFVPEPRLWRGTGFYSHMHVWSARVHDALRAEYGDTGPELVEFPDYLGEAAVTVQASRTLARWLRTSAVCVRLYTSAEMCSVLDGHLPDQLDDLVMHDLERFALRNCDHVLWPGGDVLGAYQRFYGEHGIAAPRLVRHAFTWADAETAPAAEAPGGGLRMLYLGRLERRKGVQALVRAATGLEAGDWSLTLVGADTETAPLGQSMRDLLGLAIAEDPRIELAGAVPRRQLPALIRDHDVVVLPSLWECWPNVALEALEAARPVVATPTGGFAEMVQPARSGWLARDTTAAGLADVLEPLVAAPHVVRELAESGGPRQVFEELTDPEPVRAAYLGLCEEAARGGRRRSSGAGAGPPPLVSIVVPYYRLEEFVEEAIASAVAQTHPAVEVLVVNDGSLREADAILEQLSRRYPIEVLTQENAGLGATRNFGFRQCRGRYVLPLDADNALAPEFVERAVGLLEADPQVAYVTSWSAYVDEHGRPWGGDAPGYRPVGNDSRVLGRVNLAGDAAALLRRELFLRGYAYSEELTSFEDWTLYRRLARDGHYGHVIPEPLIRYRVRGDSMARTFGDPHWDRIHREAEAWLRETEVQWTR